MNISNVPVGCQICGGTAYGKENQYKTSQGIVIECIWICAKCGGVAKRHEEVKPNEPRQG